MAKVSRIAKQELWDYVDGGLTPVRRLQIEKRLAADAELAAMVSAMRRQNEQLKSIGADAFNAPIPETMLDVLRRASVRAEDRLRKQASKKESKKSRS